MADSANIINDENPKNIFRVRRTPSYLNETAAEALAVLNTLETLIQRFSLDKLGMSDTDFVLAKRQAQIPLGTLNYVEEFGLASEIRGRLSKMGWRPPQ